MKIKVKQSTAGINAGRNPGPAAQMRSASEFLSPGDKALPGALQDMAQGLDQLHGALYQKKMEQEELDLLTDVQNYKNSVDSWLNNYQTNNYGKNGLNAGNDFMSWDAPNREALLGKWKDNNRATKYLLSHAGNYAASALDSQRKFANIQQEAWKESVFAGETARFNLIASDPNKTHEEIIAAHREYEGHARAIQQNRGLDMVAFDIQSKNVLDSALQANSFNRVMNIANTDPSILLKTISGRTGDVDTPETETKVRIIPQNPADVTKGLTQKSDLKAQTLAMLGGGKENLSAKAAALGESAPVEKEPTQLEKDLANLTPENQAKVLKATYEARDAQIKAANEAAMEFLTPKALAGTLPNGEIVNAVKTGVITREQGIMLINENTGRGGIMGTVKTIEKEQHENNLMFAIEMGALNTREEYFAHFNKNGLHDYFNMEEVTKHLEQMEGKKGQLKKEVEHFMLINPDFYNDNDKNKTTLNKELFLSTAIKKAVLLDIVPEDDQRLEALLLDLSTDEKYKNESIALLPELYAGDATVTANLEKKRLSDANLPITPTNLKRARDSVAQGVPINQVFAPSAPTWKGKGAVILEHIDRELLMQQDLYLKAGHSFNIDPNILLAIAQGYGGKVPLSAPQGEGDPQFMFSAQNPVMDMAATLRGLVDEHDGDLDGAIASFIEQHNTETNSTTVGKVQEVLEDRNPFAIFGPPGTQFGRNQADTVDTDSYGEGWHPPFAEGANFRVSSAHNIARDHPVYKDKRPHPGTDYATPIGTPLYSMGAGEVVHIGHDGDGDGGGNRVWVKLDNGYTFTFFHMDSFAAGLQVGQRVKSGQLLGKSGNTGIGKGAHVDIRILKPGKQVGSKNFHDYINVQDVMREMGGGGSGGGNAVAGGGSKEIETIIDTKAKAYGLPPSLVRGVIKTESNFNPKAVSHAGAKGLMQFMNATWEEWGEGNVYDPAANIDAGIRYLKYLLGRYDGNLTMALAAYNGGMGNLDRKGLANMPTETKNYVRLVTQRYKEYESI